MRLRQHQLSSLRPASTGRWLHERTKEVQDPAFPWVSSCLDWASPGPWARETTHPVNADDCTSAKQPSLACNSVKSKKCSFIMVCVRSSYVASFAKLEASALKLDGEPDRAAGTTSRQCGLPARLLREAWLRRASWFLTVTFWSTGVVRQSDRWFSGLATRSGSRNAPDSTAGSH